MSAVYLIGLNLQTLTHQLPLERGWKEAILTSDHGTGRDVGSALLRQLVREWSARLRAGLPTRFLCELGRGIVHEHRGQLRGSPLARLSVAV